MDHTKQYTFDMQPGGQAHRLHQECGGLTKAGRCQYCGAEIEAAPLPTIWTPVKKVGSIVVHPHLDGVLGEIVWIGGDEALVRWDLPGGIHAQLPALCRLVDLL